MLVGSFAGILMGVHAHTLGHQAVCLYLGYESGDVLVSVLESSHTCMFGDMASDADMLAVLAAGGGLAAAAFGTVLAVFLSLARARGAARPGGFVLYFLLAGLISQFANLVLEVGLGALCDDVTRAFCAACGLFLAFCIWYAQLPKHGSDRRLLTRIRLPLTRRLGCDVAEPRTARRYLSSS